MTSLKNEDLAREAVNCNAVLDGNLFWRLIETHIGWRVPCFSGRYRRRSIVPDICECCRNVRFKRLCCVNDQVVISWPLHCVHPLTEHGIVDFGLSCANYGRNTYPTELTRQS